MTADRDNLLHHDLLPSNEELRLGRLVAEGSASERAAAVVQLVAANQRLVHDLAYNCLGLGLELEDLKQEGNIGLLRAITKYNYLRGFKFSTYATWWIKQAIHRALANQSRGVRLPNYVGEKLTKLRRSQATLKVKLGREPSAKELATANDFTISQVVRFLELDRPILSLDEGRYGKSEDGSLLDRLTSDYDLEAQVVANTAKSKVTELMGKLTARERLVVAGRYGLGLARSYTLVELATKLGVSPERVRQIEGKALRKLRKHAPAALRDYLS